MISSHHCVSRHRLQACFARQNTRTEKKEVSAAAIATDMLPAQHQYIEWIKAGRTPAMTEEATRNDKTSHAVLNKLRSKPDNAECFDCTATKPGWAVLPHGVFVVSAARTRTLVFAAAS